MRAPRTACETPEVLVVRGTKKLRDRLKAPPAAADVESTTVLGDWFGNVLFWRPQVVLLVNARTLLPVFVPFAPAATLLARIPEAIGEVLRRHGVDEAAVTAELDAMEDVRVAPTNDRSVVGVMNEFAFHGDFHSRIGNLDVEELSIKMAQMPLGPLRGRTGSPDRELAAVFGIDRSNVIPFPVPPAAVAAGTGTATTYQLKVTLQGIRPPIWRRVLVDGAATLHGLHEVIQAAFGWWNYHLYEFEFGRARYGIPDPDWDFGPPARDARKTRLDTVAKAGASFTYTYDFGDNWAHKVTVESVAPAVPDVSLPTCTGGGRAAPPEDCGGTWGYAELLEILADPSHPEHTERAEWVGEWIGRNDPEAFDPSEFADNLQTLHLATFDD